MGPAAVVRTLQVSSIQIELSPALRRQAMDQARVLAVEDAANTAQILADVRSTEPVPVALGLRWHAMCRRVSAQTTGTTGLAGCSSASCVRCHRFARLFALVLECRRPR